MSQKAYSFLQVKSVDDEQRIIAGIASTVTADRYDDIMEPAGAEFVLPMPFLWQHSHSQPIGEVIAAEIKDGSIEVQIKIAKIDEEGKLKDRIEEAWQSIKTGLVKGLSIGFRGKEVAEIAGTWGLHFIKWEWYELSAVTVPANADCTITSIKSLAESNAMPPAASGKKEVASDVAKTPVGVTTKTSIKLLNPNKGGVKLL